MTTVKLSLIQAMARQEGFYAHGTRPARNNNPGDLEYGEFTKAHGATGGDPRFAIFPTAEIGLAAFACLMAGLVYRNLTIAAAIAKFAPSNENDVAEYVHNVCAWTGLQPTDIVGDHLV
jgi:hypothetical protein